MIENILSKNIARLRKEHGLTQDALAAQLGVTYQAVSKWENSASCPDVMLLPELAEIFNVSIDELFGRAPEETPPAELLPLPAGNETVVTAGEGDDADFTAEVNGIKIELQGSSVKVNGNLAFDLPWPDDDTLYAVLYRGHTLLQAEDIERSHKRLGDKVVLSYNNIEALNIHSVFSVAAIGNVSGDVDAGTSVKCGDVAGGVDAGASVECGDVWGNVDAGTNVDCGDVAGGVDAGVSVSCGDVEGDVDAGAGVSCGDVEGSVDAGGTVKCGDVEGSVDAGASVNCGDVEGDVNAGTNVSCGNVEGAIHASGIVNVGGSGWMDGRKREEELRRKSEEARRRSEEARRRSEEARRRSEEVRRRVEERRQGRKEPNFTMGLGDENIRMAVESITKDAKEIAKDIAGSVSRMFDSFGGKRSGKGMSQDTDAANRKFDEYCGGADEADAVCDAVDKAIDDAIDSGDWSGLGSLGSKADDKINSKLNGANDKLNSKLDGQADRGPEDAR